MTSLTPIACIIGLAGLLTASCADESHFVADAAPPDGTPWTYDGDIGAADSYINPCAPGPPPTVTGKVYAPNGIDPVAGASVHVPLGLPPLPEQVQCESCVAKGKFSAYTFSNADGTFTLKGVPNGTTFKLGIQKGYFRRIIEVTVPECSQLALTKEQTTLPGKNGHYGALDTVPNIAVISGAWDKLEKVLTKLGLQDVEKNIYNGRDYGTGPQSVQALMQNLALLKSYHVLLINCGTQFEDLVLAQGPARINLREYVHLGGRLFATDFSYDFVEQVFPSYIDFEASDQTPVHEPEEHNAAELGTQDLKIQGEIQDSDLKAWLGLPEIDALSADGTVTIEGFMTGWAVQKEASSDLATKVWVSAPVIWAGGAGIRPLTTSFEFFDSDNKGCGRVFFSSYHTFGDNPELLPQERILEYLLLEIGACVDIK